MRRPNALEVFQAGMIVLLMASAVLGIMTLSSAMAMKSRASASLEELQTFELAFHAANAIVEERAPLEADLAYTESEDRGRRELLVQLRRHTDEALDRFEQRAEQTGLGSTLNFAFLKAQLKSTRARGDGLLDIASTSYAVGVRTSVIRDMISSSETIAPMLAIVCRRIETADPGLGGKVGMVRLLASLHESALRLPSVMLPYVAAGTALPRDAQMEALRITQRIHALWDVGASQLVFGEDAGELPAALERLRSDYLGKGLPFLSRQIERAAIGNFRTMPSADRILEVYRPTTEPIAQLRDLYLGRMTMEAKDFSALATIRMVASLVLTSVILSILPLLAWNTYRQVLRPLLDFRDQILSISERRTITTLPYTGSVPQVRSLFGALQTLQDRERERIALDSERAALAERLRLLSVTDELTGLLNRRGFDATRHSGPPPSLSLSGDIALLTLDIDHFKAVNDTYGHKAGDIVLQAISRVLDTEVGLTGVVGRYGGEEFAILLWDGDLVQTQMLAERLRARIEATAVPIGEGLKPLRVTASFGIAFGAHQGADWTALHEYADEALYAAKMAGRNRVRITNRIVANWADVKFGPPAAPSKGMKAVSRS
ncbi:GGDEF domain-containing protein [Aureimonas sp. AU40]|uniref:GGDEF domain-containing protein n=1 Tax=Aureimonas sp. AU40 TaxID=1637747 RepID=UPI00078096B6|nr:GGDEF domain-containing protein [Aureimonas sp. AU40]